MTCNRPRARPRQALPRYPVATSYSNPRAGAARTGDSRNVAARRLAASEPGLVDRPVLRHSRHFRVHVERRLVAPRLDEEDFVRVFLRLQHIELLAAVLLAAELGMGLHQLDEVVSVFRFHL